MIKNQYKNNIIILYIFLHLILYEYRPKQAKTESVRTNGIWHLFSHTSESNRGY